MTLERQFEKFTGGPVRRAGGVFRVTLNRKGEIYFSANAYHAFGRPKAVALYYNREEDVIAVEPAYPRFVENFPVKPKQMGWSVHAASFCRHYRIEVPDTEMFNRPEINNEGILLLKLRETTRVGGVEKRKGEKGKRRGGDGGVASGGVLVGGTEKLRFWGNKAPSVAKNATDSARRGAEPEEEQAGSLRSMEIEGEAMPADVKTLERLARADEKRRTRQETRRRKAFESREERERRAREMTREQRDAEVRRQYNEARGIVEVAASTKPAKRSGGTGHSF